MLVSFARPALRRSAALEPMAGDFAYDSLGNLHEKVEGSRTVDLTYDSNNRLTQSVDTGATGTRAVGYDGRGNITSLGALAMTYDLSDQPIR